MILSHALRLDSLAVPRARLSIAFVGAGGKTTALFQLARDLSASKGESRKKPAVVVTSTTHLHVNQVRLADSHWIGVQPEDLTGLGDDLHGVTLVTGPVDGDRTTGLNDKLMLWLYEFCRSHSLPMLIEADGSRQKPLKAPADHEPVIPEWVETVVVVAGLTGLGKPLTGEVVHRPEIFAQLSGLKVGETITPEALIRVLTHPSGGMRNIPLGARRVVLLNQADTPALQAQAKMIAQGLLPCFHAAVAASLNPRSTIPDIQSEIHAVFEPVAGIILAAGGSTRFGQPKPLLDWQGVPFIRAVAETALTAGLSPVVVVSGANAEQVEAAVNDMPVMIVRNEDWQNGQSSSIRAGLVKLTQIPMAENGIKRGEYGMGEVGSAIFLLADQPQTTPAVIRALIDNHAGKLAPIVAPLVEDRRTNPVLFDRLAFPELMALSGDVGGRAIFNKFLVSYLTWHDASLLNDVDTPDDYRKLINGG